MYPLPLPYPTMANSNHCRLSYLFQAFLVHTKLVIGKKKRKVSETKKAIKSMTYHILVLTHKLDESMTKMTMRHHILVLTHELNITDVGFSLLSDMFYWNRPNRLTIVLVVYSNIPLPIGAITSSIMKPPTQSSHITRPPSIFCHLYDSGTSLPNKKAYGTPSLA